MYYMCFIETTARYRYLLNSLHFFFQFERAGDGGVGVGDGGGGGVGGEGPSTLRLEKVAASNGCRPSSPWPSLGASQIQEVVKEEGEEGEGVSDPAKHWWWWLPLPRKLGGQLPAGCGGLSL